MCKLLVELCCFVAMQNKFLADVHLGKLARLLRMLGIDTIYKNTFTNKELLDISQEQDRILLSRNASFSKSKMSRSFIVTNENPFVQLKQVFDEFNLKDQIHPFSRCIVCNGALKPVTKKTVLHILRKTLLNILRNSGSVRIANAFTGRVRITKEC